MQKIEVISAAPLEPISEKSEFAEIALAKAKIELLRKPIGAISLQVTSVGKPKWGEAEVGSHLKDVKQRHVPSI